MCTSTSRSSIMGANLTPGNIHFLILSRVVHTNRILVGWPREPVEGIHLSARVATNADNLEERVRMVSAIPYMFNVGILPDLVTRQSPSAKRDGFPFDFAFAMLLLRDNGSCISHQINPSR